MGWDSNPRYPCGHAGFQDRCLKPLGHPSGSGIAQDHVSRRRGQGVAGIATTPFERPSASIGAAERGPARSCFKIAGVAAGGGQGFGWKARTALPKVLMKIRRKRQDRAAAGRMLPAKGPRVREAALAARIADLEAELRARDDFLVIAAHELRNPMTPISARLELLLARA